MALADHVIARTGKETLGEMMRNMSECSKLVAAYRATKEGGK